MCVLMQLGDAKTRLSSLFSTSLFGKVDSLVLDNQSW